MSDDLLQKQVRKKLRTFFKWVFAPRKTNDWPNDTQTAQLNQK